MKTKITLHFYAKKTKANVAGLLPIYIRLTVDGERLEYSSKKFIEKSKWSDTLAKMKNSATLIYPFCGSSISFTNFLIVLNICICVFKY